MDPHTSCLFPLTNATQSSFLSLSHSLSFHNIHPVHMSPNAFLFSLSGFSRKNVLTHRKDYPALGHVVRLSTGKFSGLDPDGTCGWLGSHCCFVPLRGQGWRFPCQCPVSTTKLNNYYLQIPGLRLKLMAKLSFCMLFIYIDHWLSYLLQSCLRWGG